MLNDYFLRFDYFNYPTDRFLVNPVTVNQPPVVFPNMPLHPDMKPAEGQYVILVINTAAAKANTTPGRVYQWNALSYQNFSNKELQDTVILTANYAAIGMLKNRYSNINDSATQSVQFVLEARGAYIAKMLPQLLNAYPPEIQQKIHEMAQKYVNMAYEVMDYIQTVVQRNQANNYAPVQQFQQSPNPMYGNNTNVFAPQQQQQQQYQPVNTGPTFTNVQPINQNQNRGPFVTVDQARGNTAAASASPSILATGKGNQENLAVDVAGIMNMMKPDHRNAVLVKHNEELKAAALAKATAVEAPIKRELQHVAPEEVFVPQDPPKAKSIPFARSRRKHKLVEKQINGESYYTVEKKTHQEIEMDREAHRTGSIEAAIVRNTQFKINNKNIHSRSDFLKTSMDTVSETFVQAFGSTKEETPESLSHYALNGYSMLERAQTSLDEAINSTRQLKILTSSSNQLGAHRADFNLDRMFVLPTSEVQSFRYILKVTSLSQLAAKLKASLLDDTMSYAFNSALIQLDSYIKTNLLTFIRFNLGLSAYSKIGSFVEDFSDLMESLHTDGELYVETFKRRERDFITRYLTLSDQEEIIGSTDTELVNVSIAVRCSVTVVDFLYQELDVLMVPDASNIATKEDFPQLYTFLDDLVSNDFIKAEGVYYGHHWLVTADDEIIRIYVSAHDNRTIMISKV